MNKTNKGTLFIDLSKGNKIEVKFHPIGGTVWMNKNELSELFGVYIPEVDACINSILEKKILYAETTCRYHLVVKKNSIKYDIKEVNMEFIIALSFSLNTLHAKILREWFLERILKQEELISSFLTTGYGFSLN